MDFLTFLYKTAPGRILLKPLTSRKLSRLIGNFLDSESSSILIKHFIKKNKINVDDYELDGIKTFNEFFRRKIKDGKRVFDTNPESLCSPCDGLLLAWKIQKDTVIPVKQSEFTIKSLLRDDKLAAEFENGLCLVFRLCVNHYHRYCFADSGPKTENVGIWGKLHTVRPIALEDHPVFIENTREYTAIENPVFGKFIQMEVGAMLVGWIVNLADKGFAVRGQEKGYFEYGGSTIILLLKDGKVQLRDDILQNSQNGIETPVIMGETIGKAQKDW